LVHDGELSELLRVVAGLGIEVRERLGPPTEEDRQRSWDLVLGTPRRLIELDAASGRPEGARIAALAADSRTARAMLARSGIRVLVRLPVHPAALRLLVLHALYRGPERRRAPRASIGTAVRIRAGLRRRTAILLDLSVRGCRLLTTEPLPQGRRLSLALPAELAGGRPLALAGVTTRVGEADPRMPGVATVVVSFEELSGRDGRRLEAVVAAHATGPAVCADGAGIRASDAGGRTEGSTQLELEPTREPVAAENSPGERRAGSRRAFPDPVLALGGEAARVLLGRDLSAGGMRVDPHPDLRVGDELRLALHLGVRREPLVVRARVERDEGPEGCVLVFRDLGPAERAELDRTLALLPVVEMPDSGEETGGLVVSEILALGAAGAAL
jgi:hypothetical protein